MRGVQLPGRITLLHPATNVLHTLRNDKPKEHNKSPPCGTSPGAAPSSNLPCRRSTARSSDLQTRDTIAKTASGQLVGGRSRHAARLGSPRCHDRPTETSFWTASQRCLSITIMSFSAEEREYFLSLNDSTRKYLLCLGDHNRQAMVFHMMTSTLNDSSQAGAVRTPSVSSGTETPLGRPGAAGTKCRSFGDGDGDTRSPYDQNRHVSVSHGVNTNTGRSILDAEPPFGRPGDAGAKCQDAVQSRRLRSFTTVAETRALTFARTTRSHAVGRRNSLLQDARCGAAVMRGGSNTGLFFETPKPQRSSDVRQRTRDSDHTPSTTVARE